MAHIMSTLEKCFTLFEGWSVLSSLFKEIIGETMKTTYQDCKSLLGDQIDRNEREDRKMLWNNENK